VPYREQVERFLTDFKEVAGSEGGWYLARRNLNPLSDLGLTEALAKMEVMDLSVSDYCEGPIGDDNPRERGNVYVFGKDMEANEAYIKLKIAYTGEQKIAKCLSFHRAEKRLRYPFAE
jgi:hypothetical protein